MNPVTKIRKEHGLSIHDLGMLSGVHLSTVRRLDIGEAKSISPKLLKAFERMGYDVESVERDFENWRIQQEELKRKELKEKHFVS